MDWNCHACQEARSTAREITEHKETCDAYMKWLHELPPDEFAEQIVRERKYCPEYVCCEKRCCDK